MCPESRSPIRHLVLAILLLAVVAETALADASREYRKGLSAFRSENFPAAAAAFRAAIAEDRKEGLQKIRGTGVSFEDYLPFYYLGLSLEKTGQYKDAVAALEESERQGATLEKAETRNRLQSSLATLRVRAAEALPTHAPAPTATPVAVVAAPSPTARPVAIATVAAAPTAVAVSRPALLPTSGRAAPPTPTVERIVVGHPGTPSAPPGPSAELAAVRLGAEQFFRNRYEAAIELLRPHAESLPVARLLLAFSLTGRALLSERVEEAKLAEARSLYATALERGARVDADGLVSPRILELLAGPPRAESAGR